MIARSSIFREPVAPFAVGRVGAMAPIHHDFDDPEGDCFFGCEEEFDEVGFDVPEELHSSGPMAKEHQVPGLLPVRELAASPEAVKEKGTEDMGSGQLEIPEAASKQDPELEEPARKRRRLLKKTSPRAEDAPDSVLNEFPVGSDTFRVLYKKFHNRYYRWRAMVLEQESKKQSPSPADVPVKTPLKRLTMEARLKCVEAWAAYDKSNDEVKSWALNYFRQRCEAEPVAGKFIDSRSVLLTYNGSWGLVPNRQIPEGASVEEVCQQLRSRADVQDLFRDLEISCSRWKEELNTASVTYSLELCPRTWKEEGVIRMHCHVHHRHPARVRVNKASQLLYRGCLPHKCDAFMGQARVRKSCGSQAMYYLRCPKIGMVLHGGTLQPFKDFQVNGDWVMNLLQAGKIAYQDAREQIILTTKNLPRLLSGLDRWWQEHRLLQVKKVESEVMRQLAAKKKPFRDIPKVRAWIKTFSVVRFRYKFLVLCGPSGKGKTQYAVSLAREGACLELNMASAPEADLRDYDPLVHEVILFDEITPKQVLSQKKLFQAPPTRLSMASSATNCHSYQVWVHAKKMICCSNTWHHEVAQLNSADAEWIKSNSVVLDVDKPLWLESMPRPK